MSAIVGKVKVQIGTLNGSIARRKALSGRLTHKAHLVGSLATAYSSEGVKYDGDYEVIPTVDGTELNTKGKYMVDDVKIKAIPIYEASNTSGGNTVYIAGEIEME